MLGVDITLTRKWYEGCRLVYFICKLNATVCWTAVTMFVRKLEIPGPHDGRSPNKSGARSQRHGHQSRKNVSDDQHHGRKITDDRRHNDTVDTEVVLKMSESITSRRQSSSPRLRRATMKRRQTSLDDVLALILVCIVTSVEEGGYVFSLVCLSVCLSVCPSNYSQTCERILTTFYGGVGHGSRTKWYNIGGDPDHASDPGVQSPKSRSSRSAEVCALWA